MEPSDYQTSDLLKNFYALRVNSPYLPQYAYELSQRTDEIQCIYTPLRGNTTTGCTNKAVTKYGYCSKHATTLRAKRAKSRYDEALSAYKPTAPNPPSPAPKPVASSRKAPPQSPRPSHPPPPEPVKPPQEPVKPPQEESSDDNSEVEHASSFLNTQNEIGTYGDDSETSEGESETSESEEKGEPSAEESSENPNAYEDDEQISVRLIRNQWGNYWHEKTGIVFDIAKKAAYGVQHPNGRIYSLGQTEINFCKKYSWPYLSSLEDEVESEEASESNDEFESESNDTESEELQKDEFDSSDEEDEE